MNTTGETAGKTTAGKSTTATDHGPIVVDLGKKSRRQIRKVREGSGKLMDKVTLMLEDLRANGTIAADAQPVLIVVRQRERKNRFGWPMPSR